MTITATVTRPEPQPEPTRPKLHVGLFFTGEAWEVGYPYPTPAEATPSPQGPGDRILTIPTDAAQAAQDEYVRALEALFAAIDKTATEGGSYDASGLLSFARAAKAALDANRNTP